MNKLLDWRDKWLLKIIAVLYTKVNKRKQKKRDYEEFLNSENWRLLGEWLKTDNSREYPFCMKNLTVDSKMMHERLQSNPLFNLDTRVDNKYNYKQK